MRSLQLLAVLNHGHRKQLSYDPVESSPIDDIIQSAESFVISNPQILQEPGTSCRVEIPADFRWAWRKIFFLVYGAVHSFPSVDRSSPMVYWRLLLTIDCGPRSPWAVFSEWTFAHTILVHGGSVNGKGLLIQSQTGYKLKTYSQHVRFSLNLEASQPVRL